MKSTQQERPNKERPDQTPIQMSSHQGPVQSQTAQRSARPSAISFSSSPDLHEAVRRRAYQIYEQRGMAGGSDIEDWLQAEAELLDTEGQEKAA